MRLFLLFVEILLLHYFVATAVLETVSDAYFPSRKNK
jgi:hypothetical protein